MNIAIVGYGIENQSAYHYWQQKGATITICDQNAELAVPDGAQGRLGEGYLDGLDAFDVIVRTVGMHPKAILDKNPSVTNKITTAVQLFFEDCTVPIIGITGTKGKGTTSTLIHKILQVAGKKTLIAGNIGLPMLDILAESASQDVIVLELSSFQLYDLKRSPQTAVCVMVVPEHLNWHEDYDDYKRSKGNLFRYQNSDNVAIYNAFNESSTEIASASPGRKLTYAVPSPGERGTALYTAYVDGSTIFCRGHAIMEIDEVGLLGRHNLENICAAIAATWDIIDGDQNTDKAIEAITSVVREFKGLEYRLQLSRTLDGVSYYNDSFSTTPETAIAALKSFDNPKILILGGSDKSVPFDQLADEVVEGNVKHVLAIGERGPVIAGLLRDRGYTSITEAGLDDMPAVVAKAREIADDGDVVLLSTGCASFGMFLDYKDRGKQFDVAVAAL